MNNKQMLYFNRPDVSEGIMLIKQANQKNVLFFTIVTFLKKMCQPYACSRCLDLLKTFMNLSHIAILKIGNVTYYCIFPGTSKSETIKLFQNINLTGKSGTL